MKYDIPEGTKPARCRSCRAEVYWIRTAKGAPMILDPNGEPHWGTCPEREGWKGKKRSDPDSPGGQGKLDL